MRRRRWAVSACGVVVLAAGPSARVHAAPGASVLTCGGEVPFAVAAGQALNLDCPVPVP